jgi:hypothetical protein
VNARLSGNSRGWRQVSGLRVYRYADLSRTYRSNPLPGTRFGSGVSWNQTTMPDRQQLHRLIDQLPESEIPPAARFLEFLLAREAPIDADLLARIDRARDQPSPGISHSDVLREFGL